MFYLRLVLFSLRQLSLLGAWQSGAELSGSAALRQRADRHRHLQMEASRLLRARLCHDLAGVLGRAVPATDPR